MELGTWKNVPKIVFHTCNPDFNYTYLDGFYGLNKGYVEHLHAGIRLIINNFNGQFVQFTVSLSTGSNDLNEIDVLEDDDSGNTDTTGLSGFSSFVGLTETDSPINCYKYLEESIQECRDSGDIDVSDVSDVSDIIVENTAE